MPRTVYKLDPAEKTQHQRRYFEDYEEIESKLIVHPEAKVLKHVDRVTIHEDEWPMFEFEDVMPIGPDGKIANLLFAIRDGHTYSVTGRVVVDPDLKSKLNTFRGKGYTHLNRSFIMLKKPDNISIGFNPSTCWIGSESGWFEVKPAPGYRQAFERIQHVIGFFFLAIEFYEELAQGGCEGGVSINSVWEDVKEVLFLYTKFNGSGVTITEVIDALKESKDYVLEQFRKKVESEFYVAANRTFKWTEYNVYRWIVAGCPLNPPKTLPADPITALTRPPPLGSKPVVDVFKAYPKKSPTPPKEMSHSPSPPAASPPLTQQGIDGPPYLPFPPGVSHTLTFTPPGRSPITVPRWPRKYDSKAKSWIRQQTSHHGIYHSPEFPDGLHQDMHNADIFVVLACHAKACDRFAEIRPASVANSFYWDFMCEKNNAARQILYFYADKVAAKICALGPVWKESKFYKELLTVEHDPSDPRLGPKEVLTVKDLTKDGNKAVHRTKAKHRTKVEQSSNVSTPTPVNLTTTLGTTSLDNSQSSSRTAKRKSDSPKPPSKKSKVSKSRDPSPAASENVPKYDSLGKVIPARIKKCGY